MFIGCSQFFFRVVKGGISFFSGPKGGPEFFEGQRGGRQPKEKIGDRPSQTDAPPPAKNDNSLKNISQD